jgi:hypothetical protein
VRRKYRLENNDRYAAAGAPAALMERLLRDIRHLPHAAMNNRDFQPYTLVRIVLALILSLMATGASASIPPTYLSQQQERAIRVYCTYWRRSRHKAALEGDDVKRVVTELEVLYPTVFPACRRPVDEGYCLSWLEVLVHSLRRYGHRSLTAVCGNPGSEDVFPAP